MTTLKVLCAVLVGLIGAHANGEALPDEVALA
jgi:hypothetical protein